MKRMTSAQAAKELKLLNEEHDELLKREELSAMFTAAIQEDLEKARPKYDYCGMQEHLRMLEDKIIRLKHSISKFNLTYVVDDFDMTIDEMLVYITQLTARKKKLERMCKRLQKERLNTGFAHSNFIEYIYCNYDVEEAKRAFKEASIELVNAQLALDRVNTTVKFEADI